MLSIYPPLYGKDIYYNVKKKRGYGGSWASIGNNTADPKPPVNVILQAPWCHAIRGLCYFFAVVQTLGLCYLFAVVSCERSEFLGLCWPYRLPLFGFSRVHIIAQVLGNVKYSVCACGLDILTSLTATPLRSLQRNISCQQEWYNPIENSSLGV